ncbi:hypothetical protein P7M25_26160, partial [Vibrio parahaemolyticus]|nr:hypothetical protein [Vibrio parahaemolyticus]
MGLFKKLFKLSLFISSYIPLYILIFINEMDELNIKSVVEVYNMNNRFWEVVLLLSVVSIFSTIAFFNLNHTKRVAFKNVESINNDILDYFITYIIPLITVDITKNTSILVNLIIFFIIGVYYVENDLMYLNILLIFIGYKVYKDIFDNIIISKKDKDYFKRTENI